MDPGVSSLTLLNPRLMSVTPPGSRNLFANRFRVRFDPRLFSLTLFERVPGAGAKTRLTKTKSSSSPEWGQKTRLIFRPLRAAAGLLLEQAENERVGERGDAMGRMAEVEAGAV